MTRGTDENHPEQAGLLQILQQPTDIGTAPVVGMQHPVVIAQDIQIDGNRVAFARASAYQPFSLFQPGLQFVEREQGLPAEQLVGEGANPVLHPFTDGSAHKRSTGATDIDETGKQRECLLEVAVGPMVAPESQ